MSKLITRETFGFGLAGIAILLRMASDWLFATGGPLPYQMLQAILLLLATTVIWSRREIIFLKGGNTRRAVLEALLAMPLGLILGLALALMRNKGLLLPTFDQAAVVTANNLFFPAVEELVSRIFSGLADPAQAVAYACGVDRLHRPPAGTHSLLLARQLGYHRDRVAVVALVWLADSSHEKFVGRVRRTCIIQYLLFFPHCGCWRKFAMISSRGGAMFNRLHRLSFGLRAAITFAFVTVVALVVRIVPWVRDAGQSFLGAIGLPQSEALFLAGNPIMSWLMGLGILATLWLVVKIEQPTDWKAFFMLDRTDWRGFFILFGIRAVIFVVELVFLQKLLWSPIQNSLIALGAWTEITPPAPPREFLGLNIVALVTMLWVELVEEIYFRGYLQRQIIARLGAFWGIVLSLLLWDAWHIWNPAMFIRRFIITIPDAIIVHRRGRVWASMISHPLGNRIFGLLYLLQG